MVYNFSALNNLGDLVKISTKYKKLIYKNNISHKSALYLNGRSRPHRLKLLVECIKNNDVSKYQIMAMSTMASGAIPAKEAYKFINENKDRLNLASKKMSEITIDNLTDFFDCATERGGYGANRLIGVVRRIFNWSRNFSFLIH